MIFKSYHCICYGRHNCTTMGKIKHAYLQKFFCFYSTLKKQIENNRQYTMRVALVRKITLNPICGSILEERVLAFYQRFAQKHIFTVLCLNKTFEICIHHFYVLLL